MTSRKCSDCELEGDVEAEDGFCKPFKNVENPRPPKIGQEKYHKIVLCYGLLKCKTCSGLWNRDVNSANNIWKCARNAIRGDKDGFHGRPKYLERTTGPHAGYGPFARKFQLGVNLVNVLLPSRSTTKVDLNRK